LRRDPPQLLKGSRTFGVAAGGCPALSSLLRGWCEGQFVPVVAGTEGLVAPWPAYRVGGRANRRPLQIIGRGKWGR
jgi:hypothetical protein